MKPLVVTSAMTSMNGVFYPTGHVFALFASPQAAQQAAAALQAAAHQGSLAYADPEGIRREITHTADDENASLPSVGADSDIVRRIDDLARQGYHGVLIEVPDQDAIEGVRQQLTQAQAAAAFHYRTFIIEELVEQAQEHGADNPSVRVGTRAPGTQPET